MNYLRHFFLPHYTNNQRARLLHHDSILSIAFVFFVATFILSGFKDARPDVLGTTITVSIQDLLVLTNAARQQNGLQPLQYNNQLATAAYAKGQNMLQYNYWAHINPKTGETPWVFIQNAGYQYFYAGENLARGFTNAPDAMKAWMASPTHKANILSPNYRDIGFAVEQGTLTGEKNTVLIVEEFGSTYSAIPQKKTRTVSLLPEPVVQAQAAQRQDSTLSVTPTVDRFTFAKNITQLLLLLFILIFILDLIFIEKKRITRLVGHNLDHILFLLAILLFIIFMSTGAIQ